MRHAPAWITAAVVALLAAASPARAAYVPWKYNWSRNPSTIYSDTSSTSFVTLTDEPLRKAAGSSDIVATNLNVFSDADPEHPATFTNKTYTLTLFLLDVDSGKSTKLNFAGILNGDVSEFSSNVGNEFVGQTSYVKILGQHVYTVRIDRYTPPGPPGSENAGAISAHASVKITDINKTPEPSTLLLALIGGPVIGYRVWRRRRDRAPA